MEREKKASLSLLAKMGKEPQADNPELNVRKAVRFASRGKGGLALGREIAIRTNRGGRGGRGVKGHRGGRGQ